MSQPSKHFYDFGPFRLDLEQEQLLRDGQRVPLPLKVFETLRALVENHGRILEKDELMKRVWPDTFVEEGNLTVNIFLLRKVLSQGLNGVAPIETIPRRGYRFVAPVEEKVAEPGLSSRTSPAALTKIGESLQDAKAEKTREVGGSAVRTGAAASRPLLEPIVGPYPHRESGLKWLGLAAGLITLTALVVWSVMRPAPAPKMEAILQQTTNDGREKFAPLVTDGARIYFTEMNGAHVPVQVSASGGTPSEVPGALPTGQVLDISLGGSELLLRSQTLSDEEAPLEVLPLPGGERRRLGTLIGHDGAWSWDGRQLVYANGKDLYLAGGDGSNPRKLVSLEGRARLPRWSPDGSKLRFTVHPDNGGQGTEALWEVSSAGTGLHPLFPGWHNPPEECCGGWTPDGKYYVFQSQFNLWALREKSGFMQGRKPQPTQLSFGPMFLSSPLPTYDGRVYAIGSHPRLELVRYDLKSKEFRPYLQGIAGDGVESSRDLNWVSYVAVWEGTLWRRRADGSDPIQLTFPPLMAANPVWSPDGSHIAFAARAPGNPWQIQIIASEGGTPQPLLPSVRNQADPAWSPDGDSLIFGELPIAESSSSQDAIFIFDFGTGRARPIRGSEGLFSPRWSPDGHFIAALTVDEQKLMLFDFKTQEWTELLNLPIGYIHWSYDGNYIYFDAYSNEGGLFRIRVSDRKLERLASLSHTKRISGSMGWWSGVAPDGSPLVLRDAGIEEIYSLYVTFPD